MTEPKPQASSLRHRLYTIIFESDTPAGKAFDVALILAIVASGGAAKRARPARKVDA